MQRCLRDPYKFSHSATSACDRQTEVRTGGQMDTNEHHRPYRASIASCGKNHRKPELAVMLTVLEYMAVRSL